MCLVIEDHPCMSRNGPAGVQGRWSRSGMTTGGEGRAARLCTCLCTVADAPIHLALAPYHCSFKTALYLMNEGERKVLNLACCGIKNFNSWSEESTFVGKAHLAMMISHYKVLTNWPKPNPPVLEVDGGDDHYIVISAFHSTVPFQWFQTAPNRLSEAYITIIIMYPHIPMCTNKQMMAEHTKLTQLNKPSSSISSLLMTFLCKLTFLLMKQPNF